MSRSSISILWSTPRTDELANLIVSPVFMVQDANAGVRAEFTNFGDPKVVRYDLVWEGGGWRIDNISTGSWNLRQIATAQD